MTRPRTPNVRRIAFHRECYEQLEQHLHDSELQLLHKEFLLDLAALTDFLECENYIGAYSIATAMNEKFKTLIPDWEKLARLHVPKDYEVPDVQLTPSNV